MTPLRRILAVCGVAILCGLALVAAGGCPTPTPPSPGGGACGSEAVPSQAAAAGFTTCAANFDFTQPTGATWIPAISGSLATQSNWLDCSGSNSSLPWHIGSPGLGAGGYPAGYAVPCNINQTTDPVSGGTVLDLQWLNSYGALCGSAHQCEGNQSFVSMQTVYNGCSGDGGCTGLTYPMGIYTETVYRIDNTYSASYNPSYDEDVWMWQTYPSGASPLETDTAELYSGSNGWQDTALHNWANSGGGIPFLRNAALSVTSYHTYATLTTSDGATNIYGCAWLDGVFQSCQSYFAAISESNQYGNKNWLIAWVGGGNGPGTAYAPNTNEYIQYIRSWSCSLWQSSQCNGTTLYNSGGLIYWH
jgi:hypothetical protein